MFSFLSGVEPPSRKMPKKMKTVGEQSKFKDRSFTVSKSSVGMSANTGRYIGKTPACAAKKAVRQIMKRITGQPEQQLGSADSDSDAGEEVCCNDPDVGDTDSEDGTGASASTGACSSKDAGALAGLQDAGTGKPITKRSDALECASAATRVQPVGKALPSANNTTDHTQPHADTARGAPLETVVQAGVLADPPNSNTAGVAAPLVEDPLVFRFELTETTRSSVKGTFQYRASVTKRTQPTIFALLNGNSMSIHRLYNISISSMNPEHLTDMAIPSLGKVSAKYILVGVCDSVLIFEGFRD